MTDQPKIHGTADLTPHTVRGATFSMRGEGYAPEEVNEFLEQVASALHVLQGEPGPNAVQAELQRVSDLTQRIVLAAQETAQQLQEQGNRDAQKLVDQAQQLVVDLQHQASGETQRVERHIEELRTGFIEELRDMYDRIGAALYRFESASNVAKRMSGGMQPTNVAAPDASPGLESGHNVRTRVVVPAAGSHPEPAGAWGEPAPEMAEATDEDLPDDTYDEDEPLVDLRTLHQGEQAAEEAMQAPQPAAETLAAETAGFTEAVAEQAPQEAGGWLMESEPTADTVAQPQPAPEQSAPTQSAPPQAASPEGAPAADAGWLIDETPAAAEAAPVPAAEAGRDDERAEAMLGAMDSVLSQVQEPGPPPLPDPPSLTPQEGGSPEFDAVRQFILQSVHEGSSRDDIEAYLRDQLGMPDAGNVVDQIMGEGTA